MGSVTGTAKIKGKTIDICRVGWGRVKKISNDYLLVDYYPIEIMKAKVCDKIEKDICWDKLILPNIKENDWVSIHWNTAIEKLNKEKLNNLKKITKKILKLYAKK